MTSDRVIWQPLTTHMRVLLVGVPQEQLQDSLDCLQQLGQDAIAVASPEAAVREFKAQAFDLVFIYCSDNADTALRLAGDIRTAKDGTRAYVSLISNGLSQLDMMQAIDSSIDDLVPAPMTHEKLAPRIIVGVYRYSARREHNEERKRFRGLFENSGDFYILYDIISGDIVDAAEAVKSCLGYNRAELVGTHIDQYFNQLHPSEIVLSDVKPDKVHEAVALRKDGTSYDIECRISHAVLRGYTLGQLHARDISIRKEAQRKLSAYAAELKKQNIDLGLKAETDALTGIANRQQFDDVLLEQFSLAERTRGDLALVMIDIDEFKKFNDHYGHVAGDECLKKVATAIVNTLRRKTDLAARYGGEEFSLILPGTGLDGARIVAEEVRSAVQSLAIPHLAATDRDVVTLSLGIAAHSNTPFASPKELVEAADAALYRAKRAGRNRVEVANKA